MFLQKGFYKAPKRHYQFNQFLRIFLSCNNFQAYECKGEMICLEMLANDNSLPIEKMTKWVAGNHSTQISICRRISDY